MGLTVNFSGFFDDSSSNAGMSGCVAACVVVGLLVVIRGRLRGGRIEPERFCLQAKKHHLKTQPKPNQMPPPTATHHTDSWAWRGKTRRTSTSRSSPPSSSPPSPSSSGPPSPSAFVGFGSVVLVSVGRGDRPTFFSKMRAYIHPRPLAQRTINPPTQAGTASTPPSSSGGPWAGTTCSSAPSCSAPASSPPRRCVFGLF